MTIVIYIILAGIGLGLLGVVLAIGLVVAIVTLAGWVVGSLLALGRLRQSSAGWVSERVQVLQTFYYRPPNGKRDRMAAA